MNCGLSIKTCWKQVGETISVDEGGKSLFSTGLGCQTPNSFGDPQVNSSHVRASPRHPPGGTLGSARVPGPGTESMASCPPLLGRILEQ